MRRENRRSMDEKWDGEQSSSTDSFLFSQWNVSLPFESPAPRRSGRAALGPLALDEPPWHAMSPPKRRQMTLLCASPENRPYQLIPSLSPHCFTLPFNESDPAKHGISLFKRRIQDLTSLLTTIPALITPYSCGIFKNRLTILVTFWN